MRTASPQSDPRFLKIALLGGFEMRPEGVAPLALPSNKAKLLIALLALRGRPASRDWLVAHLWSDRAHGQARASLRQTLFEIRSALPPLLNALLCTDGDDVGLTPSLVRVDVDRFERLCADAACTDHAAELCSLYRGDLLAGIVVRDPASEEFLRIERERLHDLAVSTMERLLVLPSASLPGDQQMALAHRLLAIDSANETAHRTLMEHWASQGHSEKALKRYDAYCGLLSREGGPGPSLAIRSLADEIRSGRRGHATPSSKGTVSGAVVRNPARPAAWLAAPPLAGFAAAMLFAGAMVFGLIGNETLVEEAATIGTPRLALVEVSAYPPGQTDSRVAEELRLVLQSDLPARPEVALVDDVKSASHALRATVRMTDRHPRIDLVLSETINGQAIWTEVYPPADTPMASARVAAEAIIDDVAVILAAERRNNLGTGAMEARFSFARGWTHYHRHSSASDRLALRHLNDAVRHDPGHVEAHAALAALYWRCWTNRCQANLGLESYLEAWDLAETHLSLAMALPGSIALQVESRILAEKGQLHEALDKAARAVELDEIDLEAQATLSEMIVLAGRPREALRRLSVIADPRTSRSPDYLRALGRALFGLGRYDKAVESLMTAVHRAPNDKIARKHLASALGHLGRLEEAGDVIAGLDDLVRANHGQYYRMQMAEHESVRMRSGDRQRLLRGLRLAGLPE